MKIEASANTGTSPEVLDYYSRNWSRIANCYATDPDGLPVDPAWYRRRLYRQFLESHKPASVLDVGCGGGRTVLDALELGVDARGIEPVAELQGFAAALLEEHGHDPTRIQQEDLAAVERLPAASEDCIALLSVLPHVPQQRWDFTHGELARVIRPGGRYIAAYRNALFDLYTFNSFTVEFYDRSLWDGEGFEGFPSTSAVDGLKSLITKPDVPGPYFTSSKDKSFGLLPRVKSNPLTMPDYVRQFGFEVERTRFYHFHCVPPLLQEALPNSARINHQLEHTLSDDWRGHFMAAMFVIEAQRV